MRGTTATQERTARRGRLAAACVLLVAGALALGACSGGGDSDPTVLRAGQLDIKLPAGYKVVDGKVERPAQAKASGATGSSTAVSDTTETTIVATKQDPTTAMFTALSKFRACLDQEGIKFQGAPDASNPNSPTNDPDYVKGLTTCAARSNIVQAMQDQQAASANLTPAQIKQQNKGYLKWRSCMIDRGWKIPAPQPDSQGRLFSFSGTGSDQPQIVPPPGKDLLSSTDLEQCATKAQKSTSG